MKILRKIAIKNLKLNKKKTIVTIIGILLSTSLITSIITLISSFQTSTIEYTKKIYGDYHYEFLNLPIEKLDVIKSNKNIEQYFITKNIKSTTLKYKNNLTSVKLVGLSENSINKIGLNLLEGTFPKNENEIIICEDMLNSENLDIKIGSEITLQDTNNMLVQSDKEIVKKYKITGIASFPNQSLKKQFTKIDDTSSNSIVFSYLKNYELLDNVNVYVKFKDLDRRIETITDILDFDNNIINNLQTDSQMEIEQIIINDESNKYNFIVNNNLIEQEANEYLDQTSSMLYMISIIIIIIVIVVSVYCIKNIFNMSITERIKEYGLLLSIGSTKKQIKYSILYEGYLLGLLSIPLGLLLGEIYIYIIIKLINKVMTQNWFEITLIFSTNYLVILLSILLSIITIYFAERKAIKKASKFTPLDAIKNTNNFSINFNKLKDSKLLKNFFGIEGILAHRNLVRNRKSYRPTIISIILSSAVCISLVSFTNYAFRVTELYYQKYKYNIYISGDNYNELKKIATDPYIKSQYELSREDYAYIKDIDKNYSNELKKFVFSNNYKSDMILIESLGDEEYVRFINSLGLHYDNVKNKAILLDYKIDSTKIYNKIKNIEFRLFNYEKGDIIELEKENFSTKIEIAKVTKEKPMGLKNSNMAFLIVSDNFFNQYINASNSEIINSYTLYMNSNNVNNVEEYIKNNYKSSYSYLGNIDKEEKNQKTMYTTISIFLYTFISIMICIGITNIFNTITTFIELRQKEFACIKSIGMTKKQFNNMIYLESIFYSIKALIIGIPLGILISYFIYRAFSVNILTNYEFPLTGVIISIISVYILIIFCSKFSINKINKQNIIETIRNDNI